MLQERPIAELEEQCADAQSTAAVLNSATSRWHDEAPAQRGLLLDLHLANFELWHLEDQARDLLSGDATVAATKRAIDRVNQHRNDTVETIDASLLDALRARGLPDATAPLHSETPGQMLDRLSILSLKLFHTSLEAGRADVEETHREFNRSRALALTEQQTDLACCLADLWRDVLAGRKRFKLYRQLKMYNDPALNPVLYSADKRHEAAYRPHIHAKALP